MASAPNCDKIKAQARLRRAHHIEDNKKDSEWNKIIKDNKYPKCLELKDKIFEFCPIISVNLNNPPSACRTCPQFIPTPEMRRKKAIELIALINKS